MWLLLAALTAQAPAPALAAPTRGELTATLASTGSSPVELTYSFEPSAEARRFQFSILDPDGVAGRSLSIEDRASERELELDDSRTPYLRGTVGLPAGATTLTFRYSASGIRIPVVASLETLEAGNDRFTATLQLPDGSTVVDSFPSGAVVDDNRARITLPVVPAFVSLTLSERPTFWSLPNVVDASVLMLFFVAGVIALRYR